LNQSGGERRLNVAITRARREVLVFTSLLPDEIDLSRTRALGVKHLKSYLEFAMGRELASGAYETDAHIGAYESPFVELVGKTIQGKGYTVHPQVGCSGYRIDLAISDERFPEKYILGIETDGVRYNSTKCARERDKLRQAVLEKMGWKLHRIWSTDWWNNPEREIDKVVEKIEEALTEAAEKLAASEVIKRTIVEDVLVAPESVTTDEPVAPEVQLASPISVANVDDESTIEKPYVEWNYSGPSYPAEGFYDDLQKKLVCNLITEIVDFEGPIALVALTRKVCSAFNLSKATKKAIKRVEALASSCKVKSDNFNGEISYWPGDFEISSYMEYRRNTEKVSRIAGEIPSQEVAVAAFSVLESNVSLPMDDLVRATANSFGFTRIGRNVEDAMKAGIKYMDKVHPVVIEDGIVSLE
jgi:very-short-patch-repair endonuclease